MVKFSGKFFLVFFCVALIVAVPLITNYLNRPAPEVEIEKLPQYRLFNEATGEHLYTTNTKERNALASKGWDYEGINCLIPKKSDVPMYRLYNEATGAHHYTLSQEEVDRCEMYGWTYEGIAWYCGGNMPVYRLFSSKAGSLGAHHFTSSVTERDRLLGEGWSDENIGWYGYPAGDSDEEGTNVLVAYFSRTGTTETLALRAADYLNGDIFEIEAEVPYTDEDVEYNTECRAKDEQNDPTARPAIKNKIEDISQYDTIILGYPIWYGQAPRIIDTFLEGYDFSEKTIVPFCTSDANEIGDSDDYLHGLVLEKANWEEGRRFEAGTGTATLVQWFDELGIKPFLGDD